jgi:hypothetical protein
MTSGFSAKRASARASETTITSSLKMAKEQKAKSRPTSRVSKPTQDLNHCRSSSINVTLEIGTLKILAARAVMSSKAFSGGVSSNA